MCDGVVAERFSLMRYLTKMSDASSCQKIPHDSEEFLIRRYVYEAQLLEYLQSTNVDSPSLWLCFRCNVD